MNEYVIYTDSSCDLDAPLLAAWDVRLIDLTFSFEGEEREYAGGEMSCGEFYEKMRLGGCARTAAANVHAFLEAFEAPLAEGRDVLYAGLSSALSTTYNSACIAAQELSEKYPGRSICLVDTLSASAGAGLAVQLAAQQRAAGLSAAENAERLRALTQRSCAWFTVEDLEYLKRGGRVSPTVAFVGGLLGVKPILHIDGEGRLNKAATARGRRKSLEALADKFTEHRGEADGPILISHADCAQDAQLLAELLPARGARTQPIITNIGPVVGSHTGPGTVALFFLGESR